MLEPAEDAASLFGAQSPRFSDAASCFGAPSLSPIGAIAPVQQHQWLHSAPVAANQTQQYQDAASLFDDDTDTAVIADLSLQRQATGEYTADAGAAVAVEPAAASVFFPAVTHFSNVGSAAVQRSDEQHYDTAAQQNGDVSSHLATTVAEPYTATATSAEPIAQQPQQQQAPVVKAKLYQGQQYYDFSKASRTQQAQQQ
jgi:hypothetical protein